MTGNALMDDDDLSEVQKSAWVLGALDALCSMGMKTRDRQIEMALLLVGGGPIQSKYVVTNVARLNRSCATIMGLLKPPPDEAADCSTDISYRLHLVLYVGLRVGDQDQIQTRKAVIHEYADLFRRFQIVTRRVIAIGERPLIAQDVADQMVEIAKRNAAWTTKPWIPRQVAVEHAWELLQNWGRPVTVSPKSTWHRVAAALLGVANERFDLTRQMRKVLEVLKKGGTAGSPLTREQWCARPFADLSGW
jgi:hypothetical protein